MTEHPIAEPILQFFAYDHLPAKLQEVSSHFGVLARRIVNDLPQCTARTLALRKLLEAKDAAVRARLYEPPTESREPLPVRLDGDVSRV